MRYLLDKVTSRHTLEGLLKLIENQSITDAETSALYFFRKSVINGSELYILPHTKKILDRLEPLSRYTEIIRRFNRDTQVLYPAQYFKRLKRRIQEYGFTNEDSEVLALATFGTTQNKDILGVHGIVTFDRPMINQWKTQHAVIQKRLFNMQRNLSSPYCKVSLPIVEHPEFIANLIVRN